MDSSEYGRPGYVAMQAGGRQEFPKDEVNEARLLRQMQANPLHVVRRIPRKEVA
jgi:hypothetical protein